MKKTTTWLLSVFCLALLSGCGGGSGGNGGGGIGSTRAVAREGSRQALRATLNSLGSIMPSAGLSFDSPTGLGGGFGRSKKLAQTRDLEEGHFVFPNQGFEDWLQLYFAGTGRENGYDYTLYSDPAHTQSVGTHRLLMTAFDVYPQVNEYELVVTSGPNKRAERYRSRIEDADWTAGSSEGSYEDVDGWSGSFSDRFEAGSMKGTWTSRSPEGITMRSTFSCDAEGNYDQETEIGDGSRQRVHWNPDGSGNASFFQNGVEVMRVTWDSEGNGAIDYADNGWGQKDEDFNLWTECFGEDAGGDDEGFGF